MGQDSKILVDPLAPCVPNRNWRWDKSCHMTSRDLAALHAFAARLGLRRSWYQDHPALPHYDLNERRRAAAVAAGAVEITMKQCADEMDWWAAKRCAESA